MKTRLLSVAFILAGATVSNAQTTAIDFTRTDCDGTPRNLFTDLNAGKVVIMEWYMGPSCQPCKDAAKEIEGMKSALLQTYPGKVMSYVFGYQDFYTCAATKSWASGLGLTAIPMDSMAWQMPNYGGFSMPTIAVVAGTDHKVIYVANPGSGGYSKGDTAAMRTAIKAYFSPTSVSGLPAHVSEATVFPSPASTAVTIRVNLRSKAKVQAQVVNLAGQVVMQFPAEITSGTYTRKISTESLAAGNYTVHIITDGAVITRQLSIVK